MPYLLHTLTVPGDATLADDTRSRRTVSTQGTLQNEGGVAEAISVDPDQQIFRGSFRGELAGLMAREVEELFAAPSVESVALVGIDLPTTPESETTGYYALDNVNTSAGDTRVDGAHQFDGLLRRIGSRESHVRAVRTRPQKVDNPFDDGTGTAFVSVPSEARYVQWYDPVAGIREPATPTATSMGELTSYDRYDVDDASFYDATASDPHYPVLTYDVPYRAEDRADCRALDTIDDRSQREYDGIDPVVGSATVGSATLDESVTVANQWQQVFAPAHVARGDVVLWAGSLRVHVGADTGALTVEQSGGGLDQWRSIATGASQWAVSNVDLRRIGLASVEARITFVNAETRSLYRLDATLQRGADRVLWTRVPEEAATLPSGIQDLLRPTARTATDSAEPRKSLVARSDL